MPHPSRMIHEYMVFRAGLEGVDHNLAPSWYEDHWDRVGVRTYFGVTLNDAGVILSDSQNPSALERWRHARLRVVEEKDQGDLT